MNTKNKILSIALLFLGASILTAQTPSPQKMSQYTEETSPIGTEFLGGYKDADTVGGNRKFQLSVLKTYFSTNLQPLSTNLTAFSSKVAPTGAVVGTTDTQTLTNKSIDAAQLTGSMPAGRFAANTIPVTAVNATGTASSSTFLRGDASWAPLSGSGASVQGAVALTDASTIAIDATLFLPGSIGSVTLAGNRNLGNPTGAIDGQNLQFRIRQDGTGSRTLTLGSNYRFTASVSALSLNTAPNTYTYISVRYSAADGKFDVIGLVQ